MSIDSIENKDGTILNNIDFKNLSGTKATYLSNVITKYEFISQKKKNNSQENIKHYTSKNK